MATTSHGVGGVTFDSKKRAWPSEAGVFMALILIVAVFELLNRLNGNSFLFNMNDKVDLLFNKQRLDIILLQVAIVGIISIGVTQVIIIGGIDLSSGSVVGATAMIVMSFGQTAIVNGLLVAYTRIPPFIATLGMMVSARGVARWWSNGNPISFPTEGYAHLSNGDVVGTLTFGLFHWQGQNPAIVFIVLAILFHLIMRYTLYGKRSYAIGSNEAAARMSGIAVARHKVLVYTIASMLAAVAALLLTSKNLTAQAGMGVMYELDAIAMAVIGGVSLAGGRGSIVGTVIGALIFSVIISGFTSIRLDAYYQEMVKGAIIVGAVVLDQWRQQRRAREG